MAVGHSPAALFCAALLALAACGDTAQKPAPSKVAEGGIALPDASLKFLVVETLGEGKVASIDRLPGRLAMRPNAVASVGAPISGRVVSVHVRPGEPVVAGKVLLAIQSAEAAGARAGLTQARARAALAEDLLRRSSEMVAKGVAPEVERLEAETKAQEARAELARAGRAAALLGAGEGDVVSVRAPSAGVVTGLKASVGAMVAPGADALVEIGDATRLWAVADLFEAETGRIAAGQRVAVVVPGSNRQLAGVVDGFGSKVDPETRRLPVYISLQGNTSGLAAGMQVEIEFAASGVALTVPVTAVLIKEGTRRVVYVQRPDGRFEARNVRVGAVSAGRVPVHEGLAPGERIVVKGALLLDGEAEQLL